MSKLNLDYTLFSSRERQEYVATYITTIDPNENDLETIANYILYGKDEDGTSVVDRGEVEIETRNKTWSRKAHDSLDGMVEESGLTGVPIEGQYGLTSNSSGKGTAKIKYTAPRSIIDRQQILNKILDNPVLHQQFVSLWADIDRLEYITTKYDQLHGKRTKEIRKELIELIGKDNVFDLDQRASELNQFDYLKMRHRLVQYRQLQYHLKDSLGTAVSSHGNPTLIGDVRLITNALPNGLLPSHMPSPKELDPIWFGEEKRTWLSIYLRSIKPTDELPLLDFSNSTHISALVYALADLHEEAVTAEDIEDHERLLSIFRTLDFYINNSKLNEIQLEVVKGKLLGYTNQEIKKQILEKTGHTYQTTDYISTIFTKICCPEIARTAALYEGWLKTLVDDGRIGFKKCRKCNRFLLKNTQDFVRKARASDGLSSSCKDCDKKARKKK